jgi:hypothetical protein
MTAVTVTPAHRAQPRGGLATLAVLLIMVGIVAGGYFAQNAVTDLPPQPVTVAGGVVVTPLSEWEFAGRSSDGNTVLLSQGDGSLAVEVRPGTDVVAALTELRADWTESGTVTASEIHPTTSLRGGATGQRFGYSGTFSDTPSAVEGEVTAFTGNGIVVVFDGWAGLGSYPSVRDDIATMINSAVIP